MWRFKQKSTIVAVFIVFMGLNGHTQETWNLEQCIKYALDNNIQIKQQSLNVKVNENKLLSAKMSIYPNLNAGVNHNYSFGRTTNFITNQKERNDIQSSSFNISTQVTLFDGFQIKNTRQQEEFNLLASISDLEKFKNNISLNIAAAYLQILFSEELVETTKKQLELSQLQAERTSVMVKAGSLPEGNLMEIEAQVASDELQLVNAQNQLDISYLTLTQFLDLRNPENFMIQKPDLSGISQEVANDTPLSIFLVAQQALPQIKGATQRVSSAEKGVAIAKGGRSPRLSLAASYGTGAQKLLRSNPLITMDPFMDQIKDNANSNIGLSLSIPIFNGLQVKTSISTALIGLDNARLSLENEKNILFKEIQQAHADALAALKKFKATEKNLSALEEAFRYSEQKFNLGMVTSFDYTSTKTRLGKAYADLIQAKYDFIFKTKILDFYRGVPIKL